MIFTWLDEKETPALSQTDRLIGVMFDLGITTKTQLSVIMGWNATRVRSTINNIRQKAKPKDRDEWIQAVGATGRGGEATYSLGALGLTHAYALLGEDKGSRVPVSGQIAHSLGINEILCRLIQQKGDRKGVQWFGTKQASQYVYHHMTKRKFDEKRLHTGYSVKVQPPKKGRISPDALCGVNGVGSFFIEFDTGTKHGTKLEDQFHRYFQLPSETNMKMPTTIWVTVDEKRAKRLQEVYWNARSDYPKDYKFHEMQIFVAGAETSYMLGDHKDGLKLDLVLNEYDLAIRKAKRLEKELEDKQWEIKKLKDDLRDSQSESNQWEGRHESEERERKKWFDQYSRQLRRVKDMEKWLKKVEERVEKKQNGNMLEKAQMKAVNPFWTEAKGELPHWMKKMLEEQNH
ncbi:replication-relaxation family protein [Hazenella sp. IB182357]|uniref:Replication-relaxation family protein n=1 Tax=Polycladospora coralii TaxID=2771432 RepID=A0A926RUE7_9BACL|nr:replication-relaxation family protein [Polycladospora coralii]MBD1373845.1 replication-relaxation family protein [Polycladospora coralii]